MYSHKIAVFFCKARISQHFYQIRNNETNREKTISTALQRRISGYPSDHEIFCCLCKRKFVNKFWKNKNHTFCFFTLCRTGGERGKVNAAHSSNESPKNAPQRKTLRPTVYRAPARFSSKSRLSAAPLREESVKNIRRGCCKKLRLYPLNRTR